MSRADDQLEQALRALAAGSSPEEGGGQSAAAAELVPLLHLAQELRELEQLAPTPEWKAATRARLLATRAAPESLPPISPRPAAPPPVHAAAGSRGWGFARILGLAAALVLLLLSSLSSIERAVADSLPGDPLYPVKRSLEELRYTLAAEPELKSSVALEAAERRITELKVLAERGQPLPAELASDYARALDRAVTELGQSSSRQATERAAERLQEQARALATLPVAPSALTEASEALRSARQRLAEVNHRVPAPAERQPTTPPAPVAFPTPLPERSPTPPAGEATAAQPPTVPTAPTAGSAASGGEHRPPQDRPPEERLPVTRPPGDPAA
ncbi:MAG: hypothetical protein KatS3mg061_0023 [Dehalococcoidia bacterium]|nr:MAG: hypothetical protein KatS3mg061_0023 [Dehalococcoidia bacterium]